MRKALTLPVPQWSSAWSPSPKLGEGSGGLFAGEHDLNFALAQRLHDEYVRNGQEESERIVAEARANSDRLVREAATKRDETLKQLETERSRLERKIDELRNFEREYRSRLKSYLEGLLADVDARGNVSAEMGNN